MEYKINDDFRIKRHDSNNWVLLYTRRGKLKTDFGGKKAGDSFENDDVIGYAGNLIDSWKMLIRRVPNYAESKTALNKTVKDMQNLLSRFG